MKEIRDLTVKYHDRIVGYLAETKDGQAAFQYDKRWVGDGFSISPFSLPLSEKVYLPKNLAFDGLTGVFSDSLPDGWGRLLVDRLLLSKGISPREVTPIQRLSIVGSTGMGALEYEPDLFGFDEAERLDFDRIATECEKILQEEESDDLDMLFRLGGSSGGARPKVLIKEGESHWIVKFPSSFDRKSIGEEEFCYMNCAKDCGIRIPEVRLFSSRQYPGFFGAERFDRVDGKKVHMITVSGLLETSHRVPNLDYNDLMKLTYLLTHDHSQVEEMYRRMCFNVFSHNRDDHSKNFSFYYDEGEERWKMTPAYDLTYSSSIGGEHATCVNGNGRNPEIMDLLAVGKNIKLSEKWCRQTAEEIREIVNDHLVDILRSYR